MNKLSKTLVPLVYLCTLGTLCLTPSVSSKEFDVSSFLDTHLSKTNVRIGISYKLKENVIYFSRTDGTRSDVSSPIGARIGLWYQYSTNVTIGIDHHSQWFQGFPFNNEGEYSKTELFVDYTFSIR